VLLQPQHQQPNGEQYQFPRHDEISRLMGELQTQKALLFQLQQEKAGLQMRIRSHDDTINGYKVMLGTVVESNTRLVCLIERSLIIVTADERTGNANQMVAVQMDGLFRRMDEIERMTAETGKRLEGLVRNN
jgi:hypothetical protein